MHDRNVLWKAHDFLAYVRQPRTAQTSIRHPDAGTDPGPLLGCSGKFDPANGGYNPLQNGTTQQQLQLPVIQYTYQNENLSVEFVKETSPPTQKLSLSGGYYLGSNFFTSPTFGRVNKLNRVKFHYRP